MTASVSVWTCKPAAVDLEWIPENESTRLITELEPSSDVWLCHQPVSDELQLMGQLPRHDFPEVFESSHAADPATGSPGQIERFPEHS